ncbi:FeoA domain-containing protein [bacterium]|nr:FeoA domain-containing protein [bacterium]
MKTVIKRYQEFGQAKNWDLTPLHKKIIESIFHLHDHFTEIQMAQQASLANVPRKILITVLHRLVEAGLIRKIYFGEDKSYYEHVYGHIHHDHLVCLQCGAIVEFRDETIEQKQAVVCQEHDFIMVKHSLHILGICSTCRKKTQLTPASFPAEEDAQQEGESLPLSAVLDGHAARVERLEGGEGMQRRLREMGILPGSVVEVIANQFAGPFIIRVKEGKLAIGHNITHKVIVRDLGKK